MADAAEIPKGFIPARQAADLVMLSVTRLQQLVRDGYIPKSVRGHYSMVGTVQGYIRFLKDEERRTSKVQADSALKASRQAEIDQRIAEKAHRLVDTEEAVAVLDEVLGIHRSEISGVPAAVTRDLELRRKITAAIDGVFARTSTRFAERAAALRSSGKALSSETPDDT